MKGLIIIIEGLVLCVGGLINIQNQCYGCSACFCGGALIGTGVAEKLRSK